MPDSYCLSKSKYLEGLQCPKLLWMSYHAKDQLPPISPETQAIFDEGNRVTAVARTLFSEGIYIQSDDYENLLNITRDLLPKRKPLFEATFRYKNATARADIIIPNEDGSWDLLEVKSATEIKDYYYEDIAFQKYCYEGAGLQINKVYIFYINNKFVKAGAINPNELLIREDVTEQVNVLVSTVEDRVSKLIAMLSEKECPDISIGMQCFKPDDCSLQDHCWDHIPDDSVFILNKIRKEKAFGYINSGCLLAADVPVKDLKAISHQVVHKCHSENKRHINIDSIRDFISSLALPIYFIDFETIGMNVAVPIFDGTKPYQQVPFQFSLHIYRGPYQDIEHHAFLAKTKDDPRREFLAQLQSLIGSQGSMVAYNLSFERDRLKECAAAYPEYQDWFNGLTDRFVDLMLPFQKFDFYDPKQLGRYSIKAVYPALVGGSYAGLVISGGGMASLEYSRVTFRDGVSEDDRQRVYDGLLEYCKLDTMAMIEIFKVLQAVTADSQA